MSGRGALEVGTLWHHLSFIERNSPCSWYDRPKQHFLRVSIRATADSGNMGACVRLWVSVCLSFCLSVPLLCLGSEATTLVYRLYLAGRGRLVVE